jgi:hypothetical protein
MYIKDDFEAVRDDLSLVAHCMAHVPSCAWYYQNIRVLRVSCAWYYQNICDLTVSCAWYY